MITAAGYREIEHTADWELEVWAQDLPGLLEQAARGMQHLAGLRLQAQPARHLELKLSAADPESLLVTFLGELLFSIEQHQIGFSDFDLQIRQLPEDAGLELLASVQGQPLLALDKEIKAITYHRMEVQTTPAGLRTRIVFDV